MAINYTVDMLLEGIKSPSFNQGKDGVLNDGSLKGGVEFMTFVEESEQHLENLEDFLPNDFISKPVLHGTTPFHLQEENSTPIPNYSTFIKTEATSFEMQASKNDDPKILPQAKNSFDPETQVILEKQPTVLENIEPYLKAQEKILPSKDQVFIPQGQKTLDQNSKTTSPKITLIENPSAYFEEIDTPLSLEQPVTLEDLSKKSVVVEDFDINSTVIPQNSIISGISQRQQPQALPQTQVTKENIEPKTSVAQDRFVPVKEKEAQTLDAQKDEGDQIVPQIKKEAQILDAQKDEGDQIVPQIKMDNFDHLAKPPIVLEETQKDMRNPFVDVEKTELPLDKPVDQRLDKPEGKGLTKNISSPMDPVIDQSMENLEDEVFQQGDLKETYSPILSNYVNNILTNQPIYDTKAIDQQQLDGVENVSEKNYVFKAKDTQIQTPQNTSRDKFTQNTEFDEISSKMPAMVYVKNIDVKNEKDKPEFSFGKISAPMLQVLHEDVPKDSGSGFYEGDAMKTSQSSSPVLQNIIPEARTQSFDEAVQNINSNTIEKMDFTRKGKDTLEIQLHPESLGKVDVKLSVQNSSGHMEAVFSPENKEGYHAILKDQHKLKESLLYILQQESKKEGSSPAILEIRVTEPKSLEFGFSSTDKGSASFSGSNEQKSSQQNHQQSTLNYARSYSDITDLEEDLNLDNNRRLDVAV